MILLINSKEMKECLNCGETKSISEFWKRKDSKDGFRNTCKECRTKYNRIYQENNKEELSTYRREHYYQINKENILARMKKDNEENEKIKELYCEKGYTLEEIGNYFNLTPSGIAYRMERLGIKRRSHTKAAKNVTKNIDKDKLIELYINKKYPSRECANFFGVSASIILKRLRKWGISQRNNKIIIGIDKNKLKELYTDKKCSARKCGEILGHNGMLIIKRLHQYNIPIRNRFECGKGEINWNWMGGKREAQKRQEGKLKYQLNKRMRCNIIRSIKKGTKNRQRWEILIGYTVTQLKKRLQKTMPDGYNWQDFMNGDLHIDHIIPINAFNFDRPEHFDFKKCWALKNLQLLTAKENMRKHHKLLKPFQPSLAL